MSRPENERMAPEPTRRNPGPSWGYLFLRTTDRLLPEFLYKPIRAVGTLIAVLGMPEQRAHSRAYLELVRGRRVGLLDVWRHFLAFEEALMCKFRVANGEKYPCRYAEQGEDFKVWLESGGPMLLGTFHVGVSDLLGFMLGDYRNQEVCMVRLRVGNSHDTETLASRYGGRLRFVWVNEPHDMLYVLKDEIAKGTTLALQCDRGEYAARSEYFRFLGAQRPFPVTIYHLAVIFRRPVLLSVGLPDGKRGAVLHASPRFDSDPTLSREQNMVRARAHFQAFLDKLEGLMRSDPYIWFNFCSLGEKEKGAGETGKAQ